MDLKLIFVLIGLPIVIWLNLNEDSYQVKEQKSLKLLKSKYSNVVWDDNRPFDLIHPCRKYTHFDFKAVDKGKPISGIICTNRNGKPYFFIDD